MIKAILYSKFHNAYIITGQYVYDTISKKIGQVIRIESKFNSPNFFINVSYNKKLKKYSIQDLYMLELKQL